MSVENENAEWAVIGVAGGSAVSILVASVFFFMSKDAVLGMIESYGVSFCAWTAAAILFGAFAAGLVSTCLVLRLRKGHRCKEAEFRDIIQELRGDKEASDAEALRLSEELLETTRQLESLKQPPAKFERFRYDRLESDCVAIRSMDYESKVMIKAVATKEYVFLLSDREFELTIAGAYSYVERETLRDGVTRLRPSERLLKVAGGRAEVFDPVKEGDLEARDYSKNNEIEKGVLSRDGSVEWWWVGDPSRAQAFL